MHVCTEKGTTCTRRKGTNYRSNVARCVKVSKSKITRPPGYLYILTPVIIISFIRIIKGHFGDSNKMLSIFNWKMTLIQCIWGSWLLKLGVLVISVKHTNWCLKISEMHCLKGFYTGILNSSFSKTQKVSFLKPKWWKIYS